MPLSSRLPFHRPFRLSASQVAAASSGRVRCRSAIASSAVCWAGPGRSRATCWRFLSITISSPSMANRSNTRRRLRAKSVAVMVFNHHLNVQNTIQSHFTTGGNAASGAVCLALRLFTSPSLLKVQRGVLMGGQQNAVGRRTAWGRRRTVSGARVIMDAEKSRRVRQTAPDAALPAPKGPAPAHGHPQGRSWAPWTKWEGLSGL